MSPAQRAKLKADAEALIAEASNMEASSGSIQATMRGRSARREVKAMAAERDAEVVSSAYTINAGVRGKMGRQESGRLFKVEEDKERKKNAAAEARKRRQDQAEEYVKMQAQAKKETALRKKKKGSAQVVQGTIRGRKGRLDSRQMRQDWDGESAGVIQGVIRGREGKQTAAAIIQGREDSAVAIQSSIRGRVGRKKTAKKLNAFEAQQEAMRKRQAEREEYIRMLMEQNSPPGSPKNGSPRSRKGSATSPRSRSGTAGSTSGAPAAEEAAQ